jgi:hypothetical protein
MEAARRPKRALLLRVFSSLNLSKIWREKRRWRLKITLMRTYEKVNFERMIPKTKTHLCRDRPLCNVIAFAVDT